MENLKSITRGQSGKNKVGRSPTKGDGKIMPKRILQGRLDEKRPKKMWLVSIKEKDLRRQAVEEKSGGRKEWEPCSVNEARGPFSGSIAKSDEDGDEFNLT